MESGTSKEKFHNDFKEVVYTPSNEKRNSQLLQVESDNKPKNSGFLYTSAFTADLLAFASGSTIAWTSPALHRLTQSDPNVNPLGTPVTSLEESWIAGLLCLGAAVGPICVGKLADSLGRKKTLILIALPLIASYIMLTFATTINLFYIARFTGGLALGSTFTILPMYLGEITEDHNRGKFGCIMAVFITLGLLYPFVAGSLLSLKLLSFTCAVPAMLFLIFFSLFVPDSPVFLISKGSTEDAKEALKKFRNKSGTQIEKELLQITQETEKHSQKGGMAELLKRRNLRKGLVISLGLIVIQQFAGINAVLGFMGQIFDASGTGMSTYISTVLVGTIQVVATLLASATVEHLGRKFLLLVSSIGSSSTIIILGLYFYIKKKGIYDVSSLYWLPIACLMVYVVAFNVGLGPLPWAVMGEIFPPNVKFSAAVLTSSLCFLASFAVTLGFPILAGSFGMAQCFWLFGGCCVFGTVFIYVVVPETKGKTLADIQEILSK